MLYGMTYNALRISIKQKFQSNFYQKSKTRQRFQNVHPKGTNSIKKKDIYLVASD